MDSNFKQIFLKISSNEDLAINFEKTESIDEMFNFCKNIDESISFKDFESCMDELYEEYESLQKEESKFLDN